VATLTSVAIGGISSFFSVLPQAASVSAQQAISK
jgi:hypothetical protein